MTAGTGEEEAIAGDLFGGSLFTAALIDGLAGAADAATAQFPQDGVVSVLELENYIRQRVELERDRSGWRESITPQTRDLAVNEGEFFFIVTTAVPSPDYAPAISSLAAAPKSNVPAPPQAALSGEPFAGLAKRSLGTEAEMPSRDKAVSNTSIPLHCEECSRIAMIAASPYGFGVGSARAAELDAILSSSAATPFDQLVDQKRLESMGFDQLDVFRLMNVKPALFAAVSEVWASNPDSEALDGISTFVPLSHFPMSNPSLVTGKWQCRTNKIGGIIPDVTTYTWFSCSISVIDSDTLYFEKTTGSQRTKGNVEIAGGLGYYRGCGFNPDGFPTDCSYEGGKTEFKSRTSENDEAGVLIMADRNRGALLLPLPFFESSFDVLELKR
jgi:hypothetical protein